MGGKGKKGKGKKGKQPRRNDDSLLGDGSAADTDPVLSASARSLLEHDPAQLEKWDAEGARRKANDARLDDDDEGPGRFADPLTRLLADKSDAPESGKLDPNEKYNLENIRNERNMARAGLKLGDERIKKIQVLFFLDVIN